MLPMFLSLHRGVGKKVSYPPGIFSRYSLEVCYFTLLPDLTVTYPIILARKHLWDKPSADTACYCILITYYMPKVPTVYRPSLSEGGVLVTFVLL